MISRDIIVTSPKDHQAWTNSLDLLMHRLDLEAQRTENFYANWSTLTMEVVFLGADTSRVIAQLKGFGEDA